MSRGNVPDDILNGSCKSPLDRYFDRLEEVKNRVNGIDLLLVKGLDMPVSYMQGSLSKEEERRIENSIREEEVGKIRNIIITDRRRKFIQAIDEVMLEDCAMEDETLGDQLEGNVLLFTSQFSAHVFYITQQILKIIKRKQVSEQFDYLFALTYVLMNRIAWAYDYKDLNEIKRMLNLLANQWSALLSSFCNDDLGIDSEYTRPGVESFLDNFANSLPFPFEFHWNYNIYSE